jgi:biopolymer transport protein TolR
MGMSVSGKRGIMAEANVVPLIDILLVLLVIFMVIPHKQKGLQADLPQQSSANPEPEPETIVVRIAADGTLRINQTETQAGELSERLGRVFAMRAQRVAFLQGDQSLDFAAVAQILDLMHSAGATSVGLLTTELEKNR